MALRTHLINIDALIKLHDARLYALERNFQQELKTLQVDFVAEKEMMISRFSKEKRELNAIIEAIDSEESERNRELQHAFDTLREEIKGRNHEEIESLRVLLDDQIKELEQNFESEHLHYLQQTTQRSHDFKELAVEDQKLNTDIENYRKKIDNLQVTALNLLSLLKIRVSHLFWLVIL